MGLIRDWLEARSVITAAEALLTGDPCRCGHEAGAHTHHGRGIYCGSCPCNRYRKAKS